MKTKTKVISLLIVFILLLSTLIVGVLAVINTDFAVSGNIKFKATGVEATISCTGLENGTLNNGTVGSNKLTNVKIDTDLTADYQNIFSPWQDLSINFDAQANDVLLKLRIANNNSKAENLISASALVNAGDSYNCSITVLNDADKTTTALIAPGEYADYTIKFRAIDKETDVNLSNFSVNFNLKHLISSDIKSASSYSETLTFTCDEQTATASVRCANTNITSAIIPEYVLSANSVVCKVNEIEEEGFARCSSLTSISIPSTIETMNSMGSSYYDTFYNCNLLTFNTYQNGNYLGNDDNPYMILYKGIDNTATTFKIHNDCILIYRAALYKFKNIISLNLSSNVIEIGRNSFSHCSSLNSVIIPERLKTINACFISCENLSNVVLQEGLENIDRSTFAGCFSLKNIKLPDTIKSVGTDSFLSCRDLKTITISNSVTIIKNSAFYDTNLKIINYKGSKEQWDAITIEAGNDELTSATIIYNYVGE